MRVLISRGIDKIDILLVSYKQFFQGSFEGENHDEHDEVPHRCAARGHDLHEHGHRSPPVGGPPNQPRHQPHVRWNG